MQPGSKKIVEHLAVGVGISEVRRELSFRTDRSTCNRDSTKDKFVQQAKKKNANVRAQYKRAGTGCKVAAGRNRLRPCSEKPSAPFSLAMAKGW